MACAAVLEPSRDFPAWLEAQGVNAEVAQAMDSELGIRDYGVLSACVRDGLVRAELLSTARDRLPFGFYAVLRQVVKAVQGAEPHNTVTPHWDDAAASSPGDVTLGGLVDVLLALFSGLSRELLMSVRRLGVMDGPDMGVAVSSPPCAGVEHQDLIAVEEELPSEEKSQFSNHDCPMEFRNSQVQTSVTGGGGDGEQPLDEGGNSPSTEANFSPVWQEVKVESCDGKSEECQSGFIIGDVTSLKGVQELYPRSENSRGTERPRQPRASRGARGASGNVSRNVARGAAAFAVDAASTRSTTGHVSQQGPASLRVVVQSAATSAATAAAVPEPSGGPRNNRPYACELCRRRFTRHDYLQKHMRSHTGEKPYCCEVCGHGFKRCAELKIHLRMHTGEKPYGCDVCGQAFSQYGNFKRHQRMHTGEKPYRCDLCGRRFSQCSNYKRHQCHHSAAS
ncbi:uncharacterized protein LOC144717290 isoform X3 [Lampetra planeri]